MYCLVLWTEPKPCSARFVCASVYDHMCVLPLLRVLHVALACVLRMLQGQTVLPSTRCPPMAACMCYRPVLSVPCTRCDAARTALAQARLRRLQSARSWPCGSTLLLAEGRLVALTEQLAETPVEPSDKEPR
jgi:hypothetical protein